jgi:hypothetical protein
MLFYASALAYSIIDHPCRLGISALTLELPPILSAHVLGFACRIWRKTFLLTTLTLFSHFFQTSNRNIFAGKWKSSVKISVADDGDCILYDLLG